MTWALGEGRGEEQESGPSNATPYFTEEIREKRKKRGEKRVVFPLKSSGDTKKKGVCPQKPFPLPFSGRRKRLFTQSPIHNFPVH